MASRQEQIRQILSDIGQGFKADYELGKDDSTRMYYRTRNLQGLTDEAPKATNMMNTHQGIYRLREALGKLDPATTQALNERDMGLRGSTAHKTGQFLGSAANDLTQDTSRGIYWLLNALQATGEVINESALAKAVPQLYEKSPVQSKRSFVKEAGKPKEPRNLERGNPKDVEEMLARGIAKQIDDRLTPSRGYSFDDGTGELVKRNYSPGMVQSLAIPTGIAINSGLGLLTPFGGAEGYKAALPSEEDPSVTSNMLGEIGLKYIMGQTGQLLPYSEFSQVRPDVSRDEYNRYQAFKYDKNVDLDPTDGDITLPGGAIKATTEGIHGPEVQFLGRSLPVTTGVVPYLSALAGGVAGARYGQRTNRAAIGGLAGGMTGLVTGQVTGNIIEQERRRRNSVENELHGSNAEQYLN
tara:strand:+ start:1968 stop:3203 length:1236 start_codon:yes stop_codon:yes gene_type:complete